MSNISESYYDKIAQGRYSNIDAWTKVGYNEVITTVEENVWSAGGLYAFPPSAVQMEIVGSENAEDIGTILFGSRTVPVTSDVGGSTTTLLDADVDFSATAAAGDLLIVDPSGTTPEWGWITTAANGSLTFTGGLSRGGVGTTRKYLVIDASPVKGALAIKVDYLDSTYAAKTMIIPTNGTTVVTTLNDAGAAQTMLRINSFRIIGTGEEAGTGKSYGFWIIRPAGGGATYSYITLGKFRARNSAYTVPLGKTLYVNEIVMGWGDDAETKILIARLIVESNQEPTAFFPNKTFFYGYGEVLVNNASIVLPRPVPQKFVAKSDIKVSCQAVTGSGPASSVMRGYLVTN
jgi:hypothetical protein